MSLLESIDGAMLTIVDADHRLVYAWFGGAGVNIYDESGNEQHYFTIGGVSRVTAATARAAILRMIEHEHAEAE
jgi:hypothetical protein